MSRYNRNLEEMSRRIDELTKRVEALEEERAILQTLYRYGHCTDYVAEQEFLDLFTEDAAFLVRDPRQPSKEPLEHIQGRAALARFIAGRPRPPQQFFKHVLAQPLIDRQGDEAWAASYLVALSERNGVPYLRSFGRYTDRLVKRDGRWRFQERSAEREAAAHPPSGKR